MLRITWLRSASTNRLKVEGEITGPESDVFWDECQKGLAESSRFEIDLGGVGYLENTDADRLRALARSGVELVNCSAFVWALLNCEQKIADSGNRRCSPRARKRKRPPPPAFL